MKEASFWIGLWPELLQTQPEAEVYILDYLYEERNQNKKVQKKNNLVLRLNILKHGSSYQKYHKRICEDKPSNLIPSWQERFWMFCDRIYPGGFHIGLGVKNISIKRKHSD